MLFRSRHIYILLASLLNLGLCARLGLPRRPNGQVPRRPLIDELSRGVASSDTSQEIRMGDYQKAYSRVFEKQFGLQPAFCEGPDQRSHRQRPDVCAIHKMRAPAYTFTLG